jgi:hypothetical protein
MTIKEYASLASDLPNPDDEAEAIQHQDSTTHYYSK